MVVAVLVLASAMLAGCGAGSGSPRTLQWWVLPDGVDHRALAETCNAGGTFRIELEQLPRGLDQQRAEIVRRLAAGDDTIDVLSLDGSLVAEMATAGFLAPIPAAVETTLTEGVLPKAVEAATYDGELVVAPWRIDPQMLWFRGTTAERAGLDTTQPIGWDDLLAGAERLGATLQIDDPNDAGIADWVRALVAGSGGTLLDGTGRSPDVGLATAAGTSAAGIVQFYANAGIGSGPSEDARTEFSGARGGFLLAGGAVLTDPALATIVPDMNAVAYPVVESESVAPLSSVTLAVPDDAKDADLAYEAVSCLTSAESQQQMMIGSGHGATRAEVYEAEELKGLAVPSELMLEAIESGTNVPSTPYWQRVRAALDDTWLPVGSVNPSSTPADSQRAVKTRVAGGLP